MLVAVVSGLLIGDPGVQEMSLDTFSRWQSDKVVALGQVLEEARVKGAQSCIIAGGLFAPGFVTQGLVEQCMDCLEKAGLPVTYLPADNEAPDLESRVAPLENVSVKRGGGATVEGCLRFDVLEDGTCQMKAKTADEAVTKQLPRLEPSGFGESDDTGYCLIDIQNDTVCSITACGHALHPFARRTVDVTGMAQGKEALPAIRQAVASVNESACLRLELRGAPKLGFYVNTGELAKALEKQVFYVEVADESSTGLDDGAAEGDVSLMAEFIRQVEGDDTLSPVEKTRIVRCGWNALNGKGLVE